MISEFFKQAFILTDSTRHYRTEDEGKSWMPFDVPAPPSQSPNPLSFHANHFGYILYQGNECDDNICLDKVSLEARFLQCYF
jgi:hypothetical protein